MGSVRQWVGCSSLWRPAEIRCWACWTFHKLDCRRNSCSFGTRSHTGRSRSGSRLHDAVHWMHIHLCTSSHLSALPNVVFSHYWEKLVHIFKFSEYKKPIWEYFKDCCIANSKLYYYYTPAQPQSSWVIAALQHPNLSRIYISRCILTRNKR